MGGGRYLFGIAVASWVGLRAATVGEMSMTAHARRVPARIQALVALLLAALFFFGLSAPAAHAADEVDLTVAVTTKSGSALAGINVWAFPVELSAIDDPEPGIAVSGRPGQFTFDLDAGRSIAIWFDAPAARRPHSISSTAARPGSRTPRTWTGRPARTPSPSASRPTPTSLERSPACRARRSRTSSCTRTDSTDPTGTWSPIRPLPAES